ncbi:MAG TPA: hypothetical protein VJ800_01755, partial [Pseudolabrys sp.]|nr:hypothetical protein [Pseudolabrys sp.]
MSIRNVTVNNLGTITGSQNGIESTIGEINNLGTISALAVNGIAVDGSTTANVTNSGLIQAIGADATGLRSLDSGTAILNNLASGVLTAGKFGIDAITADVTNAGRIESTAAGGAAINATTATVANSGTIVSAGANTRAIDTTGDANVTNNTGGTISGRLDGIRALGTVNVNNAQGALIETTEPTFIADAIRGVGNTTIRNSGTIRSLGGSASGIVSEAGLAITNTSTGVITATRIGTFAFGDATVSNEGLIEANSSFGFAISGNGNVNVSNGGGTIRATGGNNLAIGVNGTATVTNGSGLIQTTGQDSSTISGANVKITGNAGTIEATGVNAIAIQATETADVTNSGTIRSTGDNGIAIKAANALINNNTGGTILGNLGAIRMDSGTINNAGVIQGIGVTGFGVLANNSANVFNTGAISGNIGVQANGLNNAGTVIANAGTITGTGGTAIKLSPAADTLTLLRGSQIIGLIDMGGGADTININTIVPVSRVSSLITLLPVDTILRNVINFTGTLNATPSAATPGMPAVATATQFA